MKKKNLLFLLALGLSERTYSEQISINNSNLLLHENPSFYRIEANIRKLNSPKEILKLNLDIIPICKTTYNLLNKEDYNIRCIYFKNNSFSTLNLTKEKVNFEYKINF